ncbi:MAG: hypothetical protein HUU17_04555 [Chthonomonadales bacterium]|nr:hypothetical protein [Chthonomonadales bacterium]
MNRRLPMVLTLLSVVLLAGCVRGSAPVAPRSPLGINLAGLDDWNTELPFTDVFRLAREWISQREGESWGRGPALEQTADGWVARLQPGCYAETLLCTIDSGRMPMGEYVCLYDGRGRIEFNNIKRETARSAGRIAFEPNRGTIFLRIMQTDPADPIRNIRVLIPGYEKRYQKEPFTPWFLERWKGMAAIRFMDWMRTNDSKIATWSQRPTPSYFTTTVRGAPIETMVDLCNRLKIAPWFCIPHRADDNYVRRFAELVRDSLDPSLPIYLELSNEVWNSQFGQHSDYAAEGIKRGLANASAPWEAAHRYYAIRAQEVWKIWKDALPADRRLVRVLGAQAAGSWWAEQDLLYKDTHKSCDALAIAPYVGFSIGPDTKPSIAEAAGWSVDQVMDHMERTSLDETIDFIRQSRAVADKFKLRLICYEAGQHAVGIAGSENNDAFTKTLMAANRTERMGRLYTRYLQAWKETGGGDLCCIFSSVGSWSKWGSWGLLEYYDDDTPKYRAVMDWIGAR